MKQLSIQQADGTGLTSFSFGQIPEGQVGQASLQLKNTGDTPLTGLKLWIEQDNNADSKLSVNVNGTVITGTSRDTATAIPDLDVGATLPLIAQYTAPVTPMDTADLCWIGD